MPERSDEKLLRKLHDYSIARSFSITWIQPSLASTPELQIEMHLQHKKYSGYRLRILFRDVRALRLMSQLDYNHGLGYVIVEDVRDRQWDGISYEVREGEDEGFQFYCSGYELLLETEPEEGCGQKTDYVEFEGFKYIYLEDSFVKRVIYDERQLRIELDAVLCEGHPLYTPRKEGEYHTYEGGDHHRRHHRVLL